MEAIWSLRIGFIVIHDETSVMNPFVDARHKVSSLELFFCVI